MKRKAGQAACPCGFRRDVERQIRVDDAHECLTEGIGAIEQYRCRHGTIFIGGTEYWESYHRHRVLMRKEARGKFVFAECMPGNLRYVAALNVGGLYDFTNDIADRCATWFSEINQ